MKDQSTSINGVSLIFPGPSIEGLDLSQLDDTLIVTVNMALTRFDARYCLVDKFECMRALMYYFRIKNDLSIRYTRPVRSELSEHHVVDHRSGETLSEIILKAESDGVWESHKNIVASAIDFCYSLEAKYLNIYGLDLCSPEMKTHAYSMGSTLGNGQRYSGGYWISDEWQHTADTVSQLNLEGRWSGLQIINRSPVSILTCFEKEQS